MNDQDRIQALEKALNRLNDHVAQAVLTAQAECADATSPGREVDRAVTEVAVRAIALSLLLQQPIDPSDATCCAQSLGAVTANALQECGLALTAMPNGRPN